MGYEFYIQPQDYEIAAQNGISALTLEKRIRHAAWDKQTAITKPPRQRRNIAQWRKTAEENGISYETFKRRITRHWDIERAATQPLTNRAELMKRQHIKNQKYPVVNTEELGITYAAFTARMRRGWTLEQAMTTKKLTAKETAQRAYAKSYWKLGPSIFEKKAVRV